MDNEMLVIRKADFDKLIEQLELFNENVSKLNFNHDDEKFFTRKEARSYYGFSQREVDKIYNTILEEKVTDIGKEQILAKVHIDEMLKSGIKMKHV